MVSPFCHAALYLICTYDHHHPVAKHFSTEKRAILAIGQLVAVPRHHSWLRLCQKGSVIERAYDGSVRVFLAIYDEEKCLENGHHHVLFQFVDRDDSAFNRLVQSHRRTHI